MEPPQNFSVSRRGLEAKDWDGSHERNIDCIYFRTGARRALRRHSHPQRVCILSETARSYLAGRETMRSHLISVLTSIAIVAAAADASALSLTPPPADASKLPV